MPRLSCGLLLATLIVAACITNDVQATERRGSSGTDEPTLQETLETGLKARRPEEFAFVARVVNLVDQNVLPLKLVQSTFLWARRQPRHPFQYFEKAMQVQAARLGVDL